MCINKNKFIKSDPRQAAKSNPRKNSKFETVINTIVDMQFENNGNVQDTENIYPVQNGNNLQLKIKPTIIIQEMQKDKEYMSRQLSHKSLENTDRVKNAKGLNLKGKRRVDPRDPNLTNFRLDSRINPRKR